jgi:hypothetical protein
VVEVHEVGRKLAATVSAWPPLERLDPLR